MKVDKLIEKLLQLKADGIITNETEITVPAEPDKDYDRTSVFNIVALRSNNNVAREVILVDTETEIHKGRIL